MTDAEFQTIDGQIDELENSLQEWDCRGNAATARLPWLHETIVALMQASEQTADNDQTARVKVAGLEYRTRRCRQAILRRNALTN